MIGIRAQLGRNEWDQPAGVYCNRKGLKRKVPQEQKVCNELVGWRKQKEGSGGKSRDIRLFYLVSISIERKRGIRLNSISWVGTTWDDGLAPSLTCPCYRRSLGSPRSRWPERLTKPISSQVSNVRELRTTSTLTEQTRPRQGDKDRHEAVPGSAERVCTWRDDTSTLSPLHLGLLTEAGRKYLVQRRSRQKARCLCQGRYKRLGMRYNDGDVLLSHTA